MSDNDIWTVKVKIEVESHVPYNQELYTTYGLKVLEEIIKFAGSFNKKGPHPISDNKAESKQPEGHQDGSFIKRRLVSLEPGTARTALCTTLIFEAFSSAFVEDDTIKHDDVVAFMNIYGITKDDISVAHLKSIGASDEFAQAVEMFLLDL